MNTNRLDTLNIGLLLVSMLLALAFPFELFLFVYAILGPLHYLTEINWLHEKKYFLTSKTDYYFIVFVIFMLLLSSFLGITGYSSILIYSTFFGSLILLFVQDLKKRILLLFTILVVGLLLWYFQNIRFKLIFSLFLPTIIHVYIFTILFIIVGALKSKSKMGLASLLVFIGCTLVLLLMDSTVNKSIITDYLTESYGVFKNLNLKLMKIFSFFHFPEVKLDFTAINSASNTDFMIFYSDLGIKTMRFIAFAYTYHYLNWFSKTSIIQWHKTSKIKLFTIIGLWFLSVCIYLYNYTIGLKWLYSLSIAHVLLEFPLNHKSLSDISKLLFKSKTV
jgi:hypothetical protein